MTKTVYEIGNNISEYQYFITKDREWIYADFIFDCQALSDSWSPPEVLIYEPFLKQGDLFNPTGSSLILSQKAYTVLEFFLEVSGEILPLTHKGESFFVFNVLNCVNCLDDENIIWRNPKFRIPKQYAFVENLLPRAPIFKIPETSSTRIYVWTDTDEEDDNNVIKVIEDNNLKGFSIKKLWSTDKESNS